MKKLRLDKYLADIAGGTRSEVKQMIRKGRVTVNGETVRRPEQKTDPEQDRVAVDGEDSPLCGDGILDAEQAAGRCVGDGGPQGKNGAVSAAGFRPERPVSGGGGWTRIRKGCFC